VAEGHRRRRRRRGRRRRRRRRRRRHGGGRGGEGEGERVGCRSAPVSKQIPSSIERALPFMVSGRRRTAGKPHGAARGRGSRELTYAEPPASRCVGDVDDSEVERAGVKGGRFCSSRAGSARDPRLVGGWHAASFKESGLLSNRNPYRHFPVRVVRTASRRFTAAPAVPVTCDVPTLVDTSSEFQGSLWNVPSPGELPEILVPKIRERVYRSATRGWGAGNSWNIRDRVKTIILEPFLTCILLLVFFRSSRFFAHHRKTPKRQK